MVYEPNDSCKSNGPLKTKIKVWFQRSKLENLGYQLDAKLHYMYTVALY